MEQNSFYHPTKKKKKVSLKLKKAVSLKAIVVKWYEELAEAY